MNADDPLAWESARRTRVGLAAIGAAFLILMSFVLPGLIFSDGPHVPLVDVLRNAAEPGRVADARSLRVEYFRFYDDRNAVLIAAAVARGIGYLLVGYALTFLAVAARVRVPELPGIVLRLPMIGAALFAISTILSPIGVAVAVGDFLGGSQTVEAATDIGRQTLIFAASIISFPGTLLLAAGMAAICLNGMRAGLLTRFLGVLGMLSAALFVFPLGGPLPVVQCFWFAALGVLIAGRWPGGDPPAWGVREAVPWPSQQDIREARARASGRPVPGPARDQGDDGSARNGAAGTPVRQPPAGKRKRKHRR